jgi:hypothetical protein
MYGTAIERSRNGTGTRTVEMTMKRLAIALLCVLLAGCAAPTSPTPSTSPTPTTPISLLATSASPMDSPAASPVITGGAASPSAVAIGPCRTADLLIEVTNTGVATGNVGGYLLFENTTAETCTLQGAPSLTAMTVTGAATHARIAAVVGTPFPSLTYQPLVILKPGDKAFAAYGGSDNGSTATCPPPYHTFQVTPPGNTIGVDLPAFNSWLDQDQPSCAGIDVTVIAPASQVEQFNDLSSLRP